MMILILIEAKASISYILSSFFLIKYKAYYCFEIKIYLRNLHNIIIIFKDLFPEQQADHREGDRLHCAYQWKQLPR